MEVFQEVAAEMVTRGHNPTARECRAKAKDMRLKYKKAVTSNKRSGAGRKICSYYDQLNRILHKQKRVWIAQLLQATPPKPAQQASRIRHTPARQPGGQTAPAGSREAQEPRPSTSAQAGSKNQSSTEESSGDGDGNEDSAAESEPSHQHGLPPDANMENLTAGERAALITVRRRRVTALQRFANLLTDQAAEESRAAERAEQRRHEEVLAEMRAG
ncbi:UNVERIFIED_CONTAM: hypothetical protein K2H54_018337 [Gekko kuhli]